MIGCLDRRLNVSTMPQAQRRFNGGLAVALVLVLAGGLAGAIHVALVLYLPWYMAGAVMALPCAAMLAQRSLHDHVVEVAHALDSSGLAAGQAAVAKIVGRNAGRLDEAGVSRAAVESLSENFSDGVVAPAIWGALLGLPGMVIYKAINTADSMIGHRTEKHRAFGWAAARLDDVANLPGSRLSALWIWGAAMLTPGAKASRALSAMLRDARRHRSPNAGWPEAAMAGALGFRLGGPRAYGGQEIDDPWMGGGRSALTAGDIGSALRLFRVACLLQILAVALLLALIAPWR